MTLNNDKRSRLSSKLSRIHSHIGGTTAQGSRKKRAAPERYYTMASKMGGELIERREGAYCLVTRFYDCRYRHGSIPMQDCFESDSILRSAFTADHTDGLFPLDQLVFFDTETTGLGGSGAVAFLVGVGTVVDGGLEVRQYLLPDYSDEAGLLESLAGEFSDNRIIVSYNGAAFDIPIIRDRFIINRVGRDIPMAGHLDLLHATRRLYRRRLRDCSLGNVERQLFGFERIDDIPGYLVPSVYFDWLSEERLDDMAAVLEHNRLDIVSLLFLARLLSAVHETEGASLDEIDDLHSLSRLFTRRKNLDSATGLYQRIDELCGQHPDDDVLWYHSLNFKRAGDWEQAVAMWSCLSTGSSKEAMLANIELAKYHEHRLKQPLKALDYAHEARRLAGGSDRNRRLLTYRIRRLEKKRDSRLK